MESPSLHRAGSTVPVSTHQVESSVLPVPVDKAWNVFKTFKLEKLVPHHVKTTQFTAGGPN